MASPFTTAGAISASTGSLQIGGNNVFSLPGTEFFAGLIDEVRVYNRALSAAEIARRTLATRSVRWRAPHARHPLKRLPYG